MPPKSFTPLQTIDRVIKHVREEYFHVDKLPLDKVHSTLQRAVKSDPKVTPQDVKNLLEKHLFSVMGKLDTAFPSCYYVQTLDKYQKLDSTTHVRFSKNGQVTLLDKRGDVVGKSQSPLTVYVEAKASV